MSSFLGRQFYRSTLYIYIYIYIYMCVCVCKIRGAHSCNAKLSSGTEPSSSRENNTYTLNVFAYATVTKSSVVRYSANVNFAGFPSRLVASNVSINFNML